MWETNLPWSRKSWFGKRKDRRALTEDEPLRVVDPSTPPADVSARQAERILQAINASQVLRRRGAIRARRGASKLAQQRPELVRRTVGRIRAERELAHANAELARFDDHHRDATPGRLGRVLRSPGRQILIGGLGLLDVVAYYPAVQAMYDLRDDTTFGVIEALLLALISVGMVVTAAVAAHHFKLYHEELQALDGRDDAIDPETGDWAISIAGRIHKQVATWCALAAAAALMAGSIMRVQNSGIDVLSLPALAMALFSAVPVVASAAVEYVATSGLRHERDGLVTEQARAIRAMKASERFEGGYRSLFAKVDLAWATIEPVITLQVLVALQDVMGARGILDNGLNPADGRLPAIDGIASPERLGLGVDLRQLDPEVVIAAARAIATAGFPAEATAVDAREKEVVVGPPMAATEVASDDAVLDLVVEEAQITTADADVAIDGAVGATRSDDEVAA